jgi:hypothetical protein
LIHYLSKHPEAFDPETIRVLSAALEDAWGRVQASGARFEDRAEAARTALAKQIVDIAKRGERDRKRLVEDALIRFRL